LTFARERTGSRIMTVTIGRRTVGIALVVAIAIAALISASTAHAADPSVKPGFASGDRSKAAFGLLVNVPKCRTGEKQPTKLVFTMEHGPTMFTAGCKLAYLKEGWRVAHPTTDRWLSDWYWGQGGAVALFYPRAKTSGSRTFRWAVTLRGKELDRGRVKVRTVITPARLIFKDTEVDAFQNVCVNGRYVIHSREGGRLFCKANATVRWIVSPV
jgi:hypothetical protein